MAEAIAASDQQDVLAHDDLAAAYRSLAAIVLQDRPKEALRWYQKAALISEKLHVSDPSNTKFRHNFALDHLGIGESLRRLGKNREALQNLAPALEKMKSLTESAHDQIFLIGELGRIHGAIGNILLAGGDDAGALGNYQQALAATDELIRRAPSSLYLRLQYADALESLGRYYMTLARRRRELNAEARLWFQKSLSVWQDSKRRNVAVPYSRLRESQVTALIAALDVR